MGDKLANIRSLVRDYEQVGEELWNRFNMKDPKMQGWYYRSMIDSLSSLKGSAAYEEYVELVNRLFKEE
jgi:myo-inositol-1(or 4)-monophosphatase